jgi:hypothetical protein
MTHPISEIKIAIEILLCFTLTWLRAAEGPSFSVHGAD